MRIHILLPVLNEQKRLEKGIIETYKYMEQHFSGKYWLTIVDNGSTDKTEEIAKELVAKYDTVGYLKLNQKGVGLALREGAKVNTYEILGYMDIDLSTKLDHIAEVYKILESNYSFDIVNGSRLLKESVVVGKRLSREIVSRTLKLILKLLFRMKISDSMCGFKFFRKEALDKVISISSDTNGWFYCAEILLRAEKEGIKIKEIPVVWEDDPQNTNVNVPKLAKEYLKEIWKLFKQFYFN